MADDHTRPRARTAAKPGQTTARSGASRERASATSSPADNCLCATARRGRMRSFPSPPTRSPPLDRTVRRGDLFAFSYQAMRQLTTKGVSDVIDGVPIDFLEDTVITE